MGVQQGAQGAVGAWEQRCSMPVCRGGGGGRPMGVQ